MISTRELFRLIRGPIAVAEPLGPYTGLRIGGSADYFIKPRDRNDLCRAFGYFREQGFPFLILGRGSRLLVHESGFRGTVIATHFLDRMVIDGERVEADAGVPVSTLAGRATQASLSGLGDFGEGAGTVGGALLQMDGKPGKFQGECLEWVDVLRNGRVRRLKNSELHAGISTRRIGSDVILGAGFRLRKLSGRERRLAQGGAEAVRRGSSPDPERRLPLSGGVFLDPPTLPGQAEASAGALLDACGLRGRRSGGASFSETVANCIVNHGDASSADVLELANFAREAVRERFGVELELGLVLVGCNQNVNHGSFR
jgi:UDP-N-acetylmuramate dehydrogenase